jgi:purine-binding chemotaxis protein CheW
MPQHDPLVPPRAENAESDEELPAKYLIFELGSERYACAIVKVREVIKVPPLKPVPFMVPSFTGVLNLRGQMIGVVDLRSRFQFPVSGNRPGYILIVDLGDSLLGAHVDDVISVETVGKDEIQKDFAVETRVAIDFLEGMAHIDKRMVNLVDLSKVLSSQELRKISEIGKAV